MTNSALDSADMSLIYLDGSFLQPQTRIRCGSHFFRVCLVCGNTRFSDKCYAP